MKIKNLQRHALGCASTLALLAVPAFAQDEEAVQPASAETDEAAQGEGSVYRLNQVFVTARKTSESIQNVPLSISAVSPEDLSSGAQATVESLSNAAPTVKIFKTVNQTGSYAVYIRGLGRDNNFFNVEAPVAFYVDDVLFPFQVGPVLDITGLERIEVLRGPQGTLYGRSATVGAVKYFTTRPDLDEVQAQVNATVGSNERYELNAGLSTPVVPGKFATRIDAGYHTYDGYVTDRRTGDTVNGQEGFAGRFSANYQATDDLNFFFKLEGRSDRDEPNIATSVIPTMGDNVVPRYGDFYISSTHPDDPGLNQLDAIGSTFQATYDLGNAEVKSITAYSGFDLAFSFDVIARADVPYSGLAAKVNDRTFSQEFQLTGGLFDERFNYTSGLFFLRTDTESVLFLPASGITFRTEQEARTFAAYADGSFELFDGFSLSGGLRYDNDEKDVRQATTTATSSFDVSGSDGWSKTTFRLGADYQATENVLFYANYAEGYKSGALNSITPAIPETALIFVPPENVENQEIGIKTQWFDGRVTLNIDYFWASYTDQTSAILDDRLRTLLITADADVEGLELEWRAAITDNWNFYGNLATMEGSYVNIDPLNTTLTNLPDKTPKHVPDLSYSLNTDYTIDNVFQSGGKLRFAAGYDYISETFECLNHAPACVSKPYGVTDVSVGYTFPGGRSQLILSGTNVGDTEYFKVASSAASGARWMAAPAEVMLTYRYKLN